MRFKIAYFIFFILCLGSLFFYSNDFNDFDITPKKYFSILFSSVFLLVVFFCNLNSIISINWINFIKNLFGIVFFSCSILALYSIMQFFDICKSLSVFKVSANFSNPAGLAVSLLIGFSIGLYFCNKKEFKSVYKIILIVEILMVFSIVVSFSRAAILGLIVLFCVSLLKKSKKNKGFIRFLLSICVVFSIGGLYCLKMDSAKGRILIWKCSLNMIKDKPLFGFGYNGFKKNYMSYQADFFNKNPENEFVKVADNTLDPFNEYIGILVNYGIVGFVIFLLCFIFLLRSYFRKKSRESEVAMLSLVGISTFSFFSYAFYYPFVWIVSILCIFVIIGPFKLIISSFLRVLVSLTAITVHIALCSYCIYRINAELIWKKSMIELTMLENKNSIFSNYEFLLPVLGSNYYFMYNYSAELYRDEQYVKSLQMAYRCRELITDYYLELIVVENLIKLKCYHEAINVAYKLHDMCPNRFKPLYYLLEIYKLIDDSINANQIADEIIQKKVKIPSEEVSFIIYNAKKYLMSK